MKQFLLIALVAAMLLLGCAGSSAPPAQQPAAQNNQQSANGQQPPAGSNQQPAASNNVPAVVNNQPPATQPSGSPLDDLLATLQHGGSWKVTYSITGTNMQTALQISQYVKGTDKIRNDMAVQGMESRTYILGNDAYTCTSQQGSWTCYKYTGAMQAYGSADISKGLEADSSKYTVTADGTMQVAGTTATCYQVVSSDGTSRYCVSAEGVPLYVKSTSKDNTVMEMTATSYSASVSDADFTLPATPTELPTVPNGGAGASGDACSYCSYLTGQQQTDCLSSCSSS